MPVHGAGPQAGTLLQRRYRVDARIASGGMGTVYRGWDQRLDRAIALKLLHPHLAEDDEVRERFRAEARHAARVRHPNVVAVLDQDEHDDTPFIVMELVDGPSLRAVLSRRPPLEPPELLDLLTAVCAGLDAIHRVGLVHRDVKPENLLHDEAGRLRVADFGIAQALDSTRLTPVGTMLGSVQYMAPEVVLGGTATWASDQYSLGVVAFEALTGSRPLPAEVPLAAALRHARERVPAPSTVRSGITPAVDRVVTTATARAPGDRHTSLDVLLAALRGAVDAPPADTGEPSQPRHTDVLPTPARTRRQAAPTSGSPSWHHAPAPTGAPAPVRPSTRRAPVPTHRASTHPAPPQPPVRVERRPVYVRARMSVLAIAALACTLVPIGAFGAPLLGFVALRRIDRSHGAKRGEAVAGLAILIGLARLAFRLLAQL